LICGIKGEPGRKQGDNFVRKGLDGSATHGDQTEKSDAVSNVAPRFDSDGAEERCNKRTERVAPKFKSRARKGQGGATIGRRVRDQQRRPNARAPHVRNPSLRRFVPPDQQSAPPHFIGTIPRSG
jgi:hypothetical protein